MLHATTHCMNEASLAVIEHLGFRNEALPAPGSACRVRMGVTKGGQRLFAKQSLKTF